MYDCQVPHIWVLRSRMGVIVIYCHVIPRYYPERIDGRARSGHIQLMFIRGCAETSRGEIKVTVECSTGSVEDAVRCGEDGIWAYESSSADVATSIVLDIQLPYC